MSDAPTPSPMAPPPRPRRSETPWYLVVLILLLLLWAAPYLVGRIQYAMTAASQRAKADVAKGQLAEMAEVEGVYPTVVKAITPAVVGVRVTRLVGPRGNDELMYQFRRAPIYRSEGQGSGVIVDKAGYVITNFHVVTGAQSVVVELADGRQIGDVEVIGVDELTDLAVLKIDVGQLTAASWGDSESLEVGDPVLAIGNPFGLKRTVTAGIISAKGRRTISVNASYQDFLQTDAAVNPGNSGGPLVNMRGEVIGINTAIVGSSYQGISFAIPSDLAQDVYERLKADGHVDRGWLGVAVQEVTPELAAKLKLDKVRGALIADVVPNSPAMAAGVQPADVILQWGDQPIDEPMDLTLAVARTEIGSEVEMQLIRAGKPMTLTVKVGKRSKMNLKR